MTADDHSQGAPRVSVIVPVYDPGPFLEPAVRSLLGQTLPAGEMEAIFVDDGSTDGSGARLDRLQAEHPNLVRVIHLAPSGAPGRPRNIGLEAARGEYVQFLDADDALAIDALEHLVAMADRNASDIVVGKFASASTPRSQRLFDRSVERTTVAETPRLADSSLGPTKLFRRSFLMANAIRFPEGWRQMEDQFFTIHAYARATAISILADRVVYFYNRRDDGAHLTSEHVDPVRHVANVRAVLDLIDREFPPGEVHDRVVRRLVRVEVLARVGQTPVVRLTPDERARFFDVARDLVRDRIDERALAGFAVIDRILLGWLRDDRPDDLLAMTERLADLTCTATVEDVRWREGRLEVEAVIGLASEATGMPLTAVPKDGRLLLDPALTGGSETDDISVDFGRRRIDLVLRDESTALEWYVKVPMPPVESPRAGAAPIAFSTRTRVSVDLSHLVAGTGPIPPGRWDVSFRLSTLGIQRRTGSSLSHTSKASSACLPAMVGDPAQVIVPSLDATGLHLVVESHPAELAAAVARQGSRVVRDRGHLILMLGLVSGPATAPAPARLVIRDSGVELVLPATIRGARGHVVVDAPLVGLADLSPGPHQVSIRFGTRSDPIDAVVGEATLRPPDGLRIAGLPRWTATDRMKADARWSVHRVASRASSSGGRIARRARRRVRRLVRH